MTQYNVIDDALAYAERGWFVFPCREIDSKPFFDTVLKKERLMKAKSPYTPAGFLEATLDKDKIISWWKVNPYAAIGISCGESNLFVIDIDTKAGRQGFDNFFSLNIDDSGALHSTTQGGGMHVVFTGTSNSYANKVTGVDIRSKGSYFIAPPSRIYDYDGNYRSYVALDDWSKIPADIPDGLLEKLNLLKDGGVPREKKKKKDYPIQNLNESREHLLGRVKTALYSLPSEYYDEYFHWVAVGLALKELEYDGFILWDTWSRQSSKYDSDACAYRWEKFEPRNITLASVFYWAKVDGCEK